MPFGGFAPLPIRLGGSDAEGWSPEQHAAMCAALVAAKRCAPLCWLLFQGETIYDYCGQNGNGLAYAPTIAFLGIDANSCNVTRFTFSPWIDDLGNLIPFRVRSVASATNKTGFSTFGVEATFENETTLTVRTYDPLVLFKIALMIS